MTYRTLQLRTFNRIAKIASRNSSTLTSPLNKFELDFWCLGHTKGGAAMLDVSSTTAIITLHTYIPTLHINSPLHAHKRTTLSTHGYPQ